MKEISTSLRNDFGFSEEKISYFLKLFKAYKQQKPIDWKLVHDSHKDLFVQLEDLDTPDTEKAKSLLNRLAILKLNGGLGTSMGCEGPKSLVEVKNGKNFLSLILEQIKLLNDRSGARIPLILMNSFNTDQGTLNVIQKFNSTTEIQSFCQNKFPRIIEEDETLLDENEFGRKTYYPPGHGDIFQCLKENGILDDLISRGKEFLFLSNADNLGATLNLNILNFLASKELSFLMEVTPKTKLDVKGGTLIKYGNSPLKLLEIAQVPNENISEFQDIERFRTFNTNNIWINLLELKKKLIDGINLEVIVNRKNIRDIEVLQLETAVGSAIEIFEKVSAIEVPRNRFLPVKKTSDLFLLRSDLFNLESGTLSLDSKQSEKKLPIVEFTEELNKMANFEKSFENGIPDIKNLDSLSIQGNVVFGKNVTLKGKVKIVAKENTFQVPDGAVLEDNTFYS